MESVNAVKLYHYGALVAFLILAIATIACAAEGTAPSCVPKDESSGNSCDDAVVKHESTRSQREGPMWCGIIIMFACVVVIVIVWVNMYKREKEAERKHISLDKKYMKSAIAHTVSLSFISAFGAIIIAFSQQDSFHLYETGNVAIGSMLMLLIIFAGVGVGVMKSQY